MADLTLTDFAAKWDKNAAELNAGKPQPDSASALKSAGYNSFQSLQAKAISDPFTPVGSAYDILSPYVGILKHSTGGAVSIEGKPPLSFTADQVSAFQQLPDRQSQLEVLARAYNYASDNEKKAPQPYSADQITTIGAIAAKATADIQPAVDAWYKQHPEFAPDSQEKSSPIASVALPKGVTLASENASNAHLPQSPKEIAKG